MIVSKEKGSFLINQILKYIQKSCSSSEQSQSQSKAHSNITDVVVKRHENQKNIVVKQRQRNMMRRVLSLKPHLNSDHIYRLFGFFGINEMAIQNPGFEQSYITCHFQTRIVQKVQIYHNCVVIDLTEPYVLPHQPNVQYIIEKFKSKGDMKFYEVAQMIKEVNELYKHLQNVKPPEQKPQSVKKWLDHLEDSMFVCFLGPKKFAISKSLLTYLEYDIEQFAVEVIKYRGVFAQFFSSINYSVGVKHLLKCLKHMAQLALGKLQLSDFMRLTHFHFTDFIQGKNHTKSFCDMTINFLNPAYLVHKIDYIYYKSDEIDQKCLKNADFSTAVEQEKQLIRQNQFKILRQVKNIPASMIKQNQKKIATYRIIQKIQPQIE